MTIQQHILDVLTEIGRIARDMEMDATRPNVQDPMGELQNLGCEADRIQRLARDLYTKLAPSVTIEMERGSGYEEVS